MITPKNEIPEMVEFTATRIPKNELELKFCSFSLSDGSQTKLICLAKMVLELAKEQNEFDHLDKYDLKDLEEIQTMITGD